jgi:hypothetical protein
MNHPESNAHGIGPDEGKGPNPYFAKPGHIVPTVGRRVWYVPS